MNIYVSRKLKCVCADLGPGETLITWPILKIFPDFKDQQTHDAPDVLLALFLKKLTIPIIKYNKKYSEEKNKNFFSSF